jgi:hypothetical protein
VGSKNWWEAKWVQTSNRMIILRRTVLYLGRRYRILRRITLWLDFFIDLSID